MRKLFFLFIFFTFSCSNDEIIISKAELSKYSIISDENNFDIADSLNVYLSKTIGLKLNVFNQISNNKSIILSIDSDSKDDFISIAFKDSLVNISANSKEFLFFATYEFIEKYLKVRWLSSNSTFYKQINSLKIPKSFNFLHKPPVKTRTVHSRLFYNDPIFAEKSKVTTSAFPNYIPEARVHTFHRFVPEEIYYESNPEYYALRNGKRLPTQLCLTNDEVYKIVVDKVSELFEKYPGYDVVSVSQDDNTSYCTCDKCEKLHNEFGGPAASMISFVNKIADNFRDKTISTLAYQYTRKPTTIIPKDNVLITLCSIECNRRIPISEGCVDFYEDLKGWSKLTNNIRIWDYTTQFTNFLAPFPNWNTIKPNINLFVENNAKWIFQQHSNNPSELFELRSYIMAKLLWNPDLSFNELLDDFCDNYYGKASKYIKKYVNDISKEISKNTNFFLFLYGDPSQGFESFLRPEKLVYYNSLFDQAYNEVKDDKKYSNRVKKARLSIDYASLEAHRKNFSENFPLTIFDNGIKVIPEIVLNRINRFKDITQNNNITLMNEMGFTVDEYIFYYKKALKLAVKENSAKSKKVNLLTKATKYANEDPQVLTDGALGGSSFYSNWLGFVDNDMDAIIDLGEEKMIKNISTSFLQVTNHVVFFPPKVEFLISTNKTDWITFNPIINKKPLSKKSKVNDIQTFSQPVNKLGRFVRVKANNYGAAPYWHFAADNPSWIFADEVIVE